MTGCTFRNCNQCHISPTFLFWNKQERNWGGTRFLPILMENGLWNRGGVQRRLTHISRVFLHDKHRVTSRHQLLEDCREIFRHLLKRQLNSLVLALVQVIDQVFDRLSHMMQTVTFVSENLNILQHNTQQAIIRSLKAYACFQRG